MTERLKIYLDLDGCLADFDKAYAAVVGIADKKQWPRDDTEGSFWEPIVRTKGFWSNIPLLPDAMKLWDYVRRHHYVTILSSPGTHDRERACVQKRMWVREHLGDDTNVLLKAAKEKHHYACPNSILIDDWHKNVSRWEKAGGIAIHHTSAAATIERLVALGVGR